jgi:hypothetical protein
MWMAVLSGLRASAKKREKKSRMKWPSLVVSQGYLDDHRDVDIHG